MAAILDSCTKVKILTLVQELHQSQPNQTWWKLPARSVVHIFEQKFYGIHLGFQKNYGIHLGFLPLNYTNPSQTKHGGNNQLLLTNIATGIRSDILTVILTDISTDITIDITMIF